MTDIKKRLEKLEGDGPSLSFDLALALRFAREGKSFTREQRREIHRPPKPGDELRRRIEAARARVRKAAAADSAQLLQESGQDVRAADHPEEPLSSDGQHGQDEPDRSGKQEGDDDSPAELLRPASQ